MLIRSLQIVLYVTFITTFAQSAIAESEFSIEESNTMIKEDIAATQVLNEFCPPLTSNNPKIILALQGITQTLIQDLPAPLKSLEQLKQDPEYIELYKVAKADAETVEKDELKAACEDLLNI